MKSIALSTALVAILGIALPAQDGQGRQGGRQGRQGQPGGFQMSSARMVGPMLAPLADADKNGDVTEKEWKAMVASIAGEEEGSINVEKLKLSMLGSSLDVNKDKKLDAKDFGAMFTALDRDGDKAISAQELGGGRAAPGGQAGPGGRRGGGAAGGGAQGGRRGAGGQEGAAGQERQRRPQQPGDRNTATVARMVATAADKDKSGDVTSEEWDAFVASLKTPGKDGAEGTFEPSKVAASLLEKTKAPPPPADGEGEPGARPRGFGRGNMYQSMDRFLDADGDGTVDAMDFDKIFKDLDQDKDGTIQASELQPRGMRGR